MKVTAITFTVGTLVLFASAPGFAQDSVQLPDWLVSTTSWSETPVGESMLVSQPLAQPQQFRQSDAQTGISGPELEMPGSIAVAPAPARQDELDQVTWLAGDNCDGGCDTGCGECCSCSDNCCCKCCECNTVPPGCIPLGDPCRLAREDCPIVVGGWVSFGYHSDNTRQSFAPNDLFAYNDLPDRVNMHQGWLYFEKDAVATSNTCDFGFRVDTVYGTDAQSLQATGSTNAFNNLNQGTWDASLDHGIYGWAIPQMYAEVAYGDWSVVGGYFWSPIGYESTLASQTFFYSHSLTMYNSEPFTHTGVLIQNNSLDGVELFGGYVLGWDSAWEQNNGGSAFLGGFSLTLSDAAWFTYMTNIGDFGFRGDNGYTHSLVLETQPCDNWDYVIQSDYHKVDNAFAVAGNTLEEFGVVQYLFYQLNENLALGGRCEWWNSNGPTATSQSYYELSGGINIMPHANVTIRPEIRHDWTNGDAFYTATTGNDYNNTVFGCDCVLTY